MICHSRAIRRAALMMLVGAGIVGCDAQPRAQTVDRPFDFVVGAACPGGALPNACANPTRLRSTDPLPYIRGDYGNAADPDGIYQTVWSVMLDPGDAVQNVSFQHQSGGPATFIPSRGDGGDHYRGGNHAVRIVETRDIGVQGNQYFCGGTQWPLFTSKAPVGSWADEIAFLNISRDPNICPQPLNAAYTRWQFVPSLPVLFTINRTRQVLDLPCVVSEHYNGNDIASAVSMEQFVFCKWWGNVWWANYRLGPPADLDGRVPQLPWPGPPNLGLGDARLRTNVVAWPPPTQASFGWP
jgi:hypothetical protein